MPTSTILNLIRKNDPIFYNEIMAETNNDVNNTLFTLIANIREKYRIYIFEIATKSNVNPLSVASQVTAKNFSKIF